MLLACLPNVRLFSIVAGVGIGDIKDVFELIFFAGFIQKRNTL